MTPSGGSNIANYFRFDPINGQYSYNLSAKMTVLRKGKHTLTLTLDDGGIYNLVITIK